MRLEFINLRSRRERELELELGLGLGLGLELVLEKTPDLLWHKRFVSKRTERLATELLHPKIACSNSSKSTTTTKPKLQHNKKKK